MKKILFYIVVYLCIIIPNNVFAASSDITMTCNDEVIPGGSFNCTINTLLTDTKVKGIQLNYEYDNDFSYVEAATINNWELLSHNNKGLMATKISGTGTNETIANIKFLLSNDIVVNKSYDFICLIASATPFASLTFSMP